MKDYRSNIGKNVEGKYIPTKSTEWRKPTFNNNTSKAYAWNAKQILADGGDEKHAKEDKFFDLNKHGK